MDASAAAYAAAQAGNAGYSSQTAEFFLSNYRLGKTLGIGSFGKASGAGEAPGGVGRGGVERRRAWRPGPGPLCALALRVGGALAAGQGG